ncbi:MAG: flavohemoglobin expression-modulating QEGLA motif protein [Ignavibacteriae bacterium]|nr:flavohemoglobin expression-modulating QEGLA motif protein [Ignavibacteriota bacterium]MCB9214864.1 flavohemoglobin expression-modulating QEGLA motif protein [Ignavibacteria bacterium]
MPSRSRAERRLRKVSGEFIADIRSRLVEGKPVRRTLPSGRLRIDRPLPFLVVYRRPTRREVIGLDKIVASEGSWLIISADKQLAEETRNLVEGVVETLANEFGAFLILEVWGKRKGDRRNGREETVEDQERPPTPGFDIITSKKGYSGKTSEELRAALGRIRLSGQRAEVSMERKGAIAPPGMRPLLTSAKAKELNCWVIGLQVDPIWLDQTGEEFYPLLLNRLRRLTARALKQTWYTFTTSRTTRQPPHYLSLGPNAVTRAVWEADRTLAEIDDAFDLLLAVTPVNPESAWRTFSRKKFEVVPEFFYRPIDVDPDLMKRKLYAVPIERIEDPTLAHLFAEKREELDRRLTMLRDRDTPKLCYESMQLFGIPSPELVKTALEVLQKLPLNDRDESSASQVGCDEFARLAREEFTWYRKLMPEFKGSVEVREDINQGLIVSNGKLLIGAGSTFPASRVRALLQHEVGTHVLTWANGRVQPLRQLYGGLADYDAFQEGIAVLAEYLVGGLSASRLRTIAARVVAVDAMLDKATFVDTFRLLTKEYGFSQKFAFTISMRIYRGGGLTKDAIYLYGLIHVLKYLRGSGELLPLFVGKIAARHLPVIRELQLREVLKPTPLLPRYLDEPDVQPRLDQVRKGLTVLDLAKETEVS